jgi:Zn-dependent protease
VRWWTTRPRSNAAILLFNLVPALPLDGGRVAHAIMWRRSGNLVRATARAARLGRGFGYALMALGLVSAIDGVPAALWFAVIGAFLVAAATGEQQHT